MTVRKRMQHMRHMRKSQESVLYSSALVLLIALIWLGVVAGRRADDKELHLNAFDRWKTEIGAAAVIVPWIFLMFAIGSNWSGFGYQAVSYYDTDFEYAWHYGNMYYTFSLTAADVAVISFFATFTMILFLIGYLSLVLADQRKDALEEQPAEMDFKCGS